MVGENSANRRQQHQTWVGQCPDCGKRRFPTKRAAKRAAKQMGSRKDGSRGPLNAYRCGDYWHLGHLPSVVRRGRAPRPEGPA